MTRIYEFYWQAINRFGQKQKGKRLAENAEQLEQQLHLQGFSHIRLRRNFTIATSPQTESINQLLNQLALLLGSAMPLKQCLALLAQNSRQIQCYQWLRALEEHLNNGFSFSQALTKENCFLSLQEILLIKMGEQSGTLTIILQQITQQRAKIEQLNKKIKKVMFYPILILIISLLLSSLLLLFIVPKFAELYSDKSHSLPFLTDILFSLSTLLSQHFIALFLGLFFTIVILFKVLKYPAIEQIKWQCLNIIPLFRKLIRYRRTLFFCHNTSIMLNVGVRLDQVLHSFLNSSSDPILSQTLEQTLDRLKQGFRLSESLNPAIFSDEMPQMIAIGERSAKLPEILQQIAYLYQQKLDEQIDLLSQLLEPILMLIIGAIVGTILLGLYLPIFDMGAMIE